MPCYKTLPISPFGRDTGADLIFIFPEIYPLQSVYYLL